jgi:hypothetical protein
MTKREEAIGEAVFAELMKAAKQLNVFELAALGQSYKGAPYTSLHESLRRKFCQLGIATCGRLMKLPPTS